MGKFRFSAVAIFWIIDTVEISFSDPFIYEWILVERETLQLI